MPSESDLVYDRLVANEKIKQGTKYERLAAIVFKSLDDNADVVHHLVLRADDKTASHEIDVSVNWKGKERSMLVECRDRAGKVEEGDVRDFFGKFHQLKPDVGVMLSSSGFTSGAMKFANDEGIVLAEFRPVRDSDTWVAKIVVEGHYFIPGPPTITSMDFADKSELAALEGEQPRVDPFSPVLNSDGNEVGTLSELMTAAMKEAEAGRPFEPGRVESSIVFDSPRIIELSGLPVTVNGISFFYEMFEEVEEHVIEADGVAEMLIHQLTGEGVGQGRVIPDKEFLTRAFDAKRHVVRRETDG